MTPGLATVEADTPLADVTALLMQSRFRRLPVVRKGKLVGVLSRPDLIRLLKKLRAKVAGVLAN